MHECRRCGRRFVSLIKLRSHEKQHVINDAVSPHSTLPRQNNNNNNTNNNMMEKSSISNYSTGQPCLFCDTSLSRYGELALTRRISAASAPPCSSCDWSIELKFCADIRRYAEQVRLQFPCDLRIATTGQCRRRQNSAKLAPQAGPMNLRHSLEV